MKMLKPGCRHASLARAVVRNEQQRINLAGGLPGPSIRPSGHEKGSAAEPPMRQSYKTAPQTTTEHKPLRYNANRSCARKEPGLWPPATAPANTRRMLIDGTGRSPWPRKVRRPPHVRSHPPKMRPPHRRRSEKSHTHRRSLRLLVRCQPRLSSPVMQRVAPAGSVATAAPLADRYPTLLRAGEALHINGRSQWLQPIAARARKGSRDGVG